MPFVLSLNQKSKKPMAVVGDQIGFSYSNDDYIINLVAVCIVLFCPALSLRRHDIVHEDFLRRKERK